MSATAAAAPRRAEPPAQLDLYRDDGPFARALGRAVGRSLPVPSLALGLAAAVPLFALLAAAGAQASRAALGAALAWGVLAGGASSGRPHGGRLAWLVPPTVRALEYASVLGIAAVAGRSSLPGAFALLCTVAFRHYELVYGLRYRGEATPAWVGVLGGGWEGRAIAAYVLLLADALPAGFFVLAIVLGAAFVGQSAVAWGRFSRTQRPAAYEEQDEEMEEEGQ